MRNYFLAQKLPIYIIDFAVNIKLLDLVSLRFCSLINMTSVPKKTRNGRKKLLETNLYNSSTD
jgi:hypothetical protein